MAADSRRKQRRIFLNLELVKDEDFCWVDVRVVHSFCLERLKVKKVIQFIFKAILLAHFLRLLFKNRFHTLRKSAHASQQIVLAFVFDHSASEHVTFHQADGRMIFFENDFFIVENISENNFFTERRSRELKE